MSRRVREFDRSKISQDSLKTVSPHFQLCLATNDEWRSNRKLMNDTMSTPFLSNVVGPIMHSIALDLMDLWRHKIRLSKGHPFSAFDDVFKGALDIICQATFGVKVGAIRRQIDLLSETIQVPLDSDPQVAAVLPAAEDPEFFNAILKISATVEWVCSTSLFFLSSPEGIQTDTFSRLSSFPFHILCTDSSSTSCPLRPKPFESKTKLSVTNSKPPSTNSRKPTPKSRTSPAPWSSLS